MAKYQLRTFKDLIDKVCEQLKIQTSDTESRRRIRRNINTVYLDEVIPFKRWGWLRDSKTLQAEAYVSSGTASVIQNSVTITLSTSPVTSKKGALFSVQGEQETYRIQSHTAGSSSVVLETPYNGATATAASYRIWTDAIPLPSDCKEVVEVSHQWFDRPLENQGFQEFRRTSSSASRLEGRPRYYTTSQLKDPDPYSAITSLPASVSRSSAGLVKTLTFAATLTAYVAVGDQIEVERGGNYVYNGHFVVSSVSGSSLTYTGTVPSQEATTADTAFTIKLRSSASYEAYRELLIFPSMFDKRTILHVDYQRNAEALEDDGDEPLMPVEDRIVLFYGAMWLSCDRERNPEWGAQNFQLFERKLGRMSGKTEDSPDKPMLKPSSLYMAGKRFGGRRRDLSTTGDFGNSTSGGSSSVTGTANSVAIFDANGNLIGSSTVATSALAYLLGAEGGLSATLLSGQASSVLIKSFNATTYKGGQIMFQIQRGSYYEGGTFQFTSDGSTAAYTSFGAGNAGSTGITLLADVSGGLIRFLYTSDSSGPSATLTYRTLLI